MKRVSRAVAFAAAFIFATAHAADPPAKKPMLGGLPSVLEPVVPIPMPAKPSPLSVLPIDDGKARIFWVVDYAGTVPVRWKTCQATGTASLTIIPVGSAEVIVALQGEQTIAKQTIPPVAKYPIVVAGSGKGELTLVADGVIDGEIVTLLSYRVSVNLASQPPPKDPPTDPPKDPPAKVGTKYLLIVRPNGPASQDFERTMRNAAWDELRKSGISIRDETLEKATAVYAPPSNTPLPFVVPLLISEDGTKATVVAAPVALPTDSASIKKLSEVFK